MARFRSASTPLPSATERPPHAGATVSCRTEGRYTHSSSGYTSLTLPTEYEGASWCSPPMARSRPYQGVIISPNVDKIPQTRLPKPRASNLVTSHDGTGPCVVRIWPFASSENQVSISSLTQWLLSPLLVAQVVSVALF